MGLFIAAFWGLFVFILVMAILRKRLGRRPGGGVGFVPNTVSSGTVSESYTGSDSSNGFSGATSSDGSSGFSGDSASSDSGFSGGDGGDSGGGGASGSW